MRIVFFGTGKFCIPVLKNILGSCHELAAVVTRPDVRKGRGWNVTPTLVKEIVKKAAPGIAIFQPEKISSPEFGKELESLNADVFVVVDYGKILTKEILSIPVKYCINLHPSLLPLYRGAAPVNRAILNGECVTGNTVIKMNERMDAGDILVSEDVEIGEHDTASTMTDKLSLKGALLIARALDQISEGSEMFIPQDQEKATYAPKLKKGEGRIDWNLSSPDIVRRVRGLLPWPVAFTSLDGKTVKILQASFSEVETEGKKPGEIIQADTKLVIRSGKGSVRVSKLQLEGKKAMTSDEFLRGQRTLKGKILL